MCDFCQATPVFLECNRPKLLILVGRRKNANQNAIWKPLEYGAMTGYTMFLSYAALVLGGK